VEISSIILVPISRRTFAHKPKGECWKSHGTIMVEIVAYLFFEIWSR